MKKRVLVMFGLISAISAVVWASAGGYAGASAGHRTVVPVPHGFTTVPFKGAALPGGNGPLVVAKDFAAIKLSGAQSEVSIAVDPTNPKHMLSQCNDLANFASYNCVYESFNRGKTWVSAGFSVPTFCYDPWVRFGRDGDAFVAYECSDQRIAYRNAGSATWNYFTLQNGSLFPDRDAVVVDNNPASPRVDSVYVGYDEASAGNAAHVWYSADGKGGWAKSPTINDTSSTIGVNPATGPDGTVYAVWEDFNGKKVTFDKSTNGGATWGTDHVVTNYRLGTGSFFICIPPQPDRCVVPMPFMAVDNSGGAHNGRIYVTYPDKDPVAADWNVYVRYSDDQGTTWSAETKLNDDAGGAYQFFPSIQVAGNGTVGIAFYDTRDDNALDHKTNRYWTFSTDGGVTWAANQKVSSMQSDESGAGDPNDYGDYEGTDAGQLNNIYFFQHIWTDSRTGSLAEDVWNASSKQ
jgi:BNR/Asp-box repeat